MDVGIGVAIYLSEGIADDNVQLLNRARCGAYLRRDIREDVRTISLYAAIAGRSAAGASDRFGVHGQAPSPSD